MLMVALVVAGEQVFGLPFHTQRFFKSTLLDVFGFTNTQFGDLFFAYGIAAMIAYFPGGAIADRYSARALLTISLVATGLGGLYMATIPGFVGMFVLYAYWGVTTIFLFWAALIKATRDWGGDASQGVAFGLLDGGRGLTQVLLAFIALAMFAVFMPDDVAGATAEQRTESFRYVIHYFTAVTFLTALLTWFAVPPDKKRPADSAAVKPWEGMMVVIRRPVVWAISGVIVCAYTGYKGLDNYQLYAVQILGMNEVEGGQLVALGANTRIVAPIIAGLLADRFGTTRVLFAIFVIASLSFIGLALTGLDSVGSRIIYLNIFLSFFLIYAFRGIYFALLEDSKTPKYLTGASVGMVSLIGYTPDVFFGPISGRILDANPGIVGFQNYFWFLALVSAIGVAIVLATIGLHRHRSERLWPPEHAVSK